MELDKRAMLRFLPLILLSSVQPPVARADRGETGLEIDAVPFFQGRVRVQRWTGVHVLATNTGKKDLNLTVEAWLDSSGREGVHFRRRLSLPRGSQKRLPIYLLPVSMSSELTVACRDESGRPITEVSKPVEFMNVWELHVVRVGGPIPGLDAQALATAGSAGNLHALGRNTIVGTAQLPEFAAGLESVDVLAFGETSPEDLTPKQVEAIQGWVEQGGTLVLAPGREWKGFKSKFPEGLLPAKLTDTVPTPLGEPLGRFVGTQTIASFNAPVLYGEFPGSEVVLDSSSRPLVCRWRLARGTVILLTFPPSSLGRLSPDQGVKFWSRLLGKDNTQSQGNPNQLQHYGGMGFLETLGSVLSGKASSEVSISWLVLLIMVYLLAVGPGDYFLVRKLGRPVLTWVTFPLCVALFSGISYWKAYTLKAGPMQVRQLSVVDVSPGREHQRIQTWVGVFSQENRDYEIGVDPPDGFWALGGSNFLDAASGLMRPPVAIQEMADERMLVRIPIWTSKLLRHDVEQETQWLHILTDGSKVRALLDRRAPFALQDCLLVSGGEVLALPAMKPGDEVMLGQDERTRIKFQEWLASSNLQSVSYRRSPEGHEASPSDIKKVLYWAMFSADFRPQVNQPTRYPYSDSDEYFSLSSPLKAGQSVFLGWAEQPAVNLKFQDAKPEHRAMTLVRCVFGPEKR